MAWLVLTEKRPHCGGGLFTQVHMVLKKHVWLLSMSLTCLPGWATDFIAGTAPHRRPLNAPVVQTHTLPAATKERYVHGVEKPVPPKVQQVAETGAWFVPLRFPGLTPPYDLRGHHAGQTQE